MDLLEPCLPRVDYFVPNLAEAQALTGLDESEDVARALLDCGVGAVGLKMGAAECLVMANTGEPRAFAGVWQNWPFEQTACLANAIGALCVTGVGATGGMHSLPGALVFVESRPKAENAGGDQGAEFVAPRLWEHPMTIDGAFASQQHAGFPAAGRTGALIGSAGGQRTDRSA